MELEEKIDRYLEGDMSIEEKLDIEMIISNDKELSKMIELRKAIRTEIINRNDIQSIMLKEEKGIKRKMKWTYLAVAASLFLLISIGLLQSTKMSNMEIVNQYAYIIPEHSEIDKLKTENYIQKISDNGILLRGEECFFENLNRIECKQALEALTYYFDGRFDESYLLFEEVLKPISKNVELSLFMAIAMIEAEKKEKALGCLLTLKSIGNEMYKEDVDYYLAIAYIQNDQLLKGRKILQTIGQNSKYYTKAQDVLKKMKLF